LNGTDLNVTLAMGGGDAFDVDVEFDSEPVLTVTKQAYEHILKSLDNIALPPATKIELDDDEDEEAKEEHEEKKQQFKAITATLRLHDLTVDMRDESNKPTVKLIFSDFKLDFSKQREDCFTTNLILGGLEAIDSLETPESHMLRSRKPSRRLRKSASWPRGLNTQLKEQHNRHKRLSSYGVSMPHKIHQINQINQPLSRTHSFVSRTRPKLQQRGNKSVKTTTSSSSDEASLVKIFIKQKNPPNRTGEREIKIKFSELEAGVNLQTWVMLLDFLTPSSASLQETQPKSDTSSCDGLTKQARINRRQVIENQGAPIDIQIEFVVDRFSILFKKPEYRFAKASIENFEMRLILWEKTHRYSGALQKLTFYDLSPCGAAYRERFVTMNEKALGFELFRYTKMDVECQRDWDIRFKLNMAQIKYIHTHRFQSELVAYFLHFHQLQELVNHYRAAVIGESKTELGRGSRVKLEITAKNPTLILPESTHSDKLIVADLGNLTVNNTFPRDGDAGTLNCESYQQREREMVPQYKCLLDCIHVRLKDMDIWTAQRVDGNQQSDNNQSSLQYGTYYIRKAQKSLLKEPVLLNLQVERNLEQTKSRTIPDMAIVGKLSRAYFKLTQKQFWTVRGFLDHNLGEMQPIYAQPGTGNFSEMTGHHNNLETVISGVVFTNLHFALGLQNVTVELGFDETALTKLVRMEFIQSKLLFQAMSNNHKHTSLVCQSYSATDLRPDVDIHPSFRDVIQTSKGANNNKVQVELFFKATPTGLSFKIVMETSRIIIQPDWMKTTLAFLLEHPDPAYSDSIRQKVLDHIRGAHQEPHNPGASGEVEIGKRLPLDITSNVHETRFILVDNLADPFSHGIILKSTALMTKDDQSACLSLQSLEVFSCEILNESETSLSILDPTSFDFTYHDIPGRPILLDVNLNAIQMRLSYRDYLLLMSIANQVKRSASGGDLSISTSVSSDEKEQKVFWGAEPMCTISQEDIVPDLPKLVELPEGNGTLMAESVTLVLIDDSGDRDIPLIEFEAMNDAV